MLVGAGGTAWWLLRPDGAVDWSQKVTDFRYGKQLSLTGSIFVPTAAATTACPLLVLVDPTKHGHRICAAFASQCEKYGVVCVASDVFGGTVAPDDPTSAADVIAYARANANVDSGRVVVLGSGVAAEVALRLAMLGPEVYAGAILEFVGLSSWRDVNALARNDVAYFLFTRTNDSGRDAIVTLKDEMQRKGLAVTLDELPGGHKDMEDDELDAAFAWMASLNRQ
jgi:pimeloyl-ACP methyl ester carboxylesterase